jgi:Flp pilus assembly protein TadD
MNAGQINRAVALLRQAASLDPDSVVIRNDLGRALRIQSTVRARP